MQSELVQVGVMGWHGRTWKTVRLIGETPKRYRIQAIEETRLPCRVLQPGHHALVPKSAVRRKDLSHD